MKRIAFTTSGRDLEATIDARFGRAQGFLLYDLDSREVQFLENRQARNSPQGAGIQAAETIVKAGADALVTGHCGPKAYKVLEAAGVTVYNCSLKSVEEALAAMRSGSLIPATAADVEGHW